MNLLTVVGIRPDFIRMSEVFASLDKHSMINHTMIHTGQHFDKIMSDVFFKELKIREPDFCLGIGGHGVDHIEQLSILIKRIRRTIEDNKLEPDLILFLGDSNSVCASLPLKKMGYKIAHIEAGMRSGDKRMLEEINRTVCDHCSDLHFVYHEDYRDNLMMENINPVNIHIVGNTIVEVCRKNFNTDFHKVFQGILVDIHRPENFNDHNRLQNIMNFVKMCSENYGQPAYMLNFPATTNALAGIDMKHIKKIGLLSYKEFLKRQYNSLFMISDSGTAQEEPALLDTPVIVPRDFTERPQSMRNKCSVMVDVNTKNVTWYTAIDWLNSRRPIDASWLGDGTTSKKIVDIIAKGDY